MAKIQIVKIWKSGDGFVYSSFDVTDPKKTIFIATSRDSVACEQNTRSFVEWKIKNVSGKEVVKEFEI